LWFFVAICKITDNGIVARHYDLEQDLERFKYKLEDRNMSSLLILLITLASDICSRTVPDHTPPQHDDLLYPLITTMCYQKRLVYGACNHSAPLGLASTCADAKACEGPRVHPIKTIRVDQMCPACRDKKAKVDNRLTTFAEKVRRLREGLAKRGFGDGETAGRRSSKGTSSSVKDREEGDSTRGDNGKQGTSRAPAEHGVGGGNRSPAEHNPDLGRSNTLRVSYTAPGTEDPFSHTSEASSADTPVKRNDMFVGGICLASTSLTTIRGKHLL
jgi:hypothetical protein